LLKILKCFIVQIILVNNENNFSLCDCRTEVEHMVGTPQPVPNQRSEVAFPVSAASSAASVGPSAVGSASPRVPRPYRHSNTAPTASAFRSMSAEPEMRRERIIPIRMEGDSNAAKEQPRDSRPPMPMHAASAQNLQKTASAASTAPPTPPPKREPLSRQSTTESDAESKNSNFT
jgi:hypothetical protein